MRLIKHFLLFFIAIACPKLFAHNNQFSLISCNVLFQGHYFNHAAKKMPLKQRSTAFQKVLSSINIPDITCFQEWPHNQNSDQYKQFNKALEKLNNTHAFFSDAQLKKNKGDGLLTGYNKSIFKKIAVHSKKFLTTGATDKTFLALQLRHNASGQVVGIINTHLKGGMPPSKIKLHYSNNRYLDFRIAQLKEIENYIKQEQTVDSWIICGDFNLNIASEDKKTYDLFRKNVLTDWKDIDPAGQNKNEYKPITTTVVFNQKNQKNEFQRLDYCFFTNNLKSTNTQFLPSNRHHLIKHQQDSGNPKQKLFYDDYFSDHALLYTIFTFKKKEIKQPKKSLLLSTLIILKKKLIDLALALSTKK